MNKVLIGIVALLVIGGGAYFLLGSKDTETTTSRTTGVVENELPSDGSDKLIGEGALSALFDMGTPMTCTFTTEDAEGSSKGVFKQSGSKYRVNVVTVGSGGTYETNMINNGDKTFVWGDGTLGDTALMYSNVEGEDDTFFGDDEDEEGFDADQSASYDCDLGLVSGSEFVPPANIDFMDMDTMMQGF